MEPRDWLALASIVALLTTTIASLFARSRETRRAQLHEIALKREERALDRREGLYVDMLEAVRRMERMATEPWRTSESLKLPLIPVEELDQIEARVAVLASTPVREQFESWYRAALEYRERVADVAKRRDAVFPEGYRDVDELRERLRPELDLAREVRNKIKVLREQLQRTTAVELSPHE